MKNLSVFFNSFHKILHFLLLLSAFFFPLNFVLAEDVYYRWTPFNDSGTKIWNGNWSETVDVTETAVDGSTSTRSEGKFWSFYNETLQEWMKTYKKGSGQTADFPGSTESKTSFVYFTGEHSVEAVFDYPAAIELEALYVGDCYKNSTSAGSEPVSINLNGNDLKTKKIIFGNSSFSSASSVNFKISGGGTLKVSGEMSFAAGCTYNIEIGEGTILDVGSVYAVASNVSGAKINFTGGGTLKFNNAAFSNCAVNFEVKNLEFSEKLEFSGTAAATFSEKLENSGTISFSGSSSGDFEGAVENIAAGTISFQDESSGDFKNILTTSGELSFSGNSSGKFANAATNSGKVSFSGNSSGVFEGAVENLSGGNISSAGAAELGFSGEFSNSGSFSAEGSAKNVFSGKFSNSDSGTVRFSSENASAEFSEFSNSGEIYTSGAGLKFNVPSTDSGIWFYSGGTVVSEKISYNVLNLSGSVKIDGTVNALSAKEISVGTEKIEIQGKISADKLSINTSKSVDLQDDATFNVASVVLGSNATIKNNGHNLYFGTDEKECSLTSSVGLKSLNFATSNAGATYFYSCKIGSENDLNVRLVGGVALVFRREVYAASIKAGKKVEIYSEKIVTSGAQAYSSEVAVSGAGKTEFVSKSGSVQFSANVSGEENAEISVLADTVLSDTVKVSVPSGIFSVGSSSGAKKTTVNANSSVSFDVGSADFSGNFNNSGTIEFSGTAAATFSEKFENSGTISFSGSASGNFEGAVENIAAGTISFLDESSGDFKNILINSGELSFSGESSGKFANAATNSGKLSFSGSSSGVFEGAVENLAAGTISFLEESSGDFKNILTNSGELSFSGESSGKFANAATNSGKFSFSGNSSGSFEGAVENLSGGNISSAGVADLGFSGEFSNSGNFSAEGAAKNVFSGKFSNLDSGTVRFSSENASAEFSEFSNSGEIYTSGASLKFNVQALDSGSWFYSGGTVVSENISYNVLNLSGSVKIDGTVNALSAKEISVGTEKIEIQGKISADSAKINASGSLEFTSDAAFSVDSVLLQNDVSLKNNGYSVLLGKTDGIIEGNVNFSISDGASPGKVEFYSALGTSETPLKDFSSESELVFRREVYAASINAAKKVEIYSEKILTSGAQNYSSEVAVSGAGKTEFVSKSGFFHFSGAVKTSGGAPVSFEGKSVQLDSDFECDSEAAFLADVYFSGFSKDEIKIQAEKIEIGSGNSVKNLYISAADGNSSKKVELNSPLEISGSFVLLNGNLRLGKNSSGKISDILAANDIVLLNGNSSSMFNDVVSSEFSWRSGAENIFEYQGNADFPNEFPDGTPISSENFYSSLGGLGGNTIAAGKNFYSNNLNLEGDSKWFLKAGDNGKSENFAAAYNSSLKNCVYSSSGAGISYLAAAESSDKGGNNENVCFGHPEIYFARTVYDDVIEVSFKDSVSGSPVKIENSKNEIWENIAENLNFLTYGNAGEKTAFSGTYIDPECTESTENQGDVEKFYLKAPDSWNTDATGKSSGAAQSTDMQGVHKEVVPYLNIVRAVSGSFSGIFDEHKNRIASYDGKNRFLEVEDSCPPVMIAVRTGQEQHEDLPENQLPYDSHNFLEFQFSEEIFANGKDSSVLNVQTSSDFGGIKNNSSGGGFLAAGIAEFEKGKINLVSESQISSEELNSVYRNFALSVEEGEIPQTHRFRISIAGYQSQSAAENPSGFPYWPGCIDSENSEIPSGKITPVSAGAKNNFNEFIKDFEGNCLLVNSVENHSLKNLSVISNSSADSLNPDWSSSLYGGWDLSAPVFASYRSLSAKEVSAFREILGACKNADTVLDRIEFHVFDNAEDDFGGAEWFSQFGWGEDNSSLFSEDSYASDIFGGSRPFGNSSGNESAKTSGGIRYSTLYNKSSYFKYGVDSGEPSAAFKNSRILAGASSSLFLAQNGEKREISTNDSLYFSIFLENGTNLPLKTNFSIKYDENGYVTDLAGNLMKSAEVASVDRVSPRFNMTSAKISGNKLYILFNKKINLGEVELCTSEGVKKSYGIADSLRFIKIPEDSHKFSEADVVSDLYIEKSVPPQKTFSSDTFTGVVFTLNRKVTLEDVKNYYIQCYSPDSGKFIDPFSGIKDVKVTAVTDTNIGNYMPHGEAHALSDFAVNAVNPVYAYDDRFLDENFGFSVSDAGKSNLSVHDWNSEQQNDGTLLTEHDIFVVTSQNSGDSEPDETLPQNITMYFDNSPEPDAVSSEYNKNLGKNLRVWIPSLVENGSSAEQVSPVLAIAPSVNSKNLSVSGEIDKNIAKFSIDWETLSKNGYSSGNQVSFLFGLADSDGSPVKISHAPVFDEISGVYKLEPQPLFALRLKNSNDPTSLDLWSFRLKNIALQRGNVTILNNVIDVNQGEMAVVQVNMPSSGNLNVVVMTLDGNVVRYLQHGTASAGEHSYSWNGTAKSGKKVARGLYFVRVFGNGIDETRKIMVVKN